MTPITLAQLTPTMVTHQALSPTLKEGSSLMDSFEYEGILVAYDPNYGTYHLTDICYELDLGTLQLHLGPGWILIPTTNTFFDSGNLNTIASLLRQLNIETTEGR